jgi:hypothetical protein
MEYDISQSQAVNTVSQVLAELGFTAASKDVSEANLRQYAQMVLNILRRERNAEEKHRKFQYHFRRWGLV